MKSPSSIAFDVFDDQKIQPVFFVDVVDRHDAGMIQLRNGSRLLKEAFTHGITDVRQQNFERDFAPQSFIDCLIDRRCRAFAEEFCHCVSIAKRASEHTVVTCVSRYSRKE